MDDGWEEIMFEGKKPERCSCALYYSYFLKKNNKL